MNLIQALLNQLYATQWYEYIAVCTGIVSVWYSKQEHVLVYPIGLISTLIYIYMCVQGNLFGEASVNVYYTIMSVVGWYTWLHKDALTQATVLRVTYSSHKQVILQLTAFVILYIVLYAILVLLKQQFVGAIPWADALATASAYTGMYLMVRKKVESWYWWLVTNAASIPLFYYKGYLVSSVYYIILLVLAVYGLRSWKGKALVV